MPTSRNLAAMAVIALAIGGCTGRPDCTEIGGANGVTFDYGATVTGSPGELTITACVAGACSEHARTTVSGERPVDLHVPVPGLRPGRTPVTLRIRTAEGVDVFSGATEVNPRKYQPNGAGCEPTLYQAAVVATGTDTLTPR